MSIRENDPAASPDWCHSCCKLEPLPAVYHIVCGECGHVFVTAEDLVAAFKAYFEPRIGQVLDVKTGEIYACPKCGHDF